MTNKKRIKELENIIEILDTSFEKGEDCINPLTLEIVLDNEYDSLKQELFDLCPSSEIFNSVTSSKVENSGEKVIHDPYMVSINKCNGTEEEKFEILNKWFEDCRKIDKDVDFSMSYKIDGCACSLIYKKGVLLSAGLRSRDGKSGVNITEKTQYIKNIPQQLKIPISCTIRGEIETSISEYKKQCEMLGDEKKMNPRAHTAGSLNQKTAEKMKNRGLEFCAYSILNLENAPFKTEIELRKWATETLKLKFVETIPFSFEKLEEMEEKHREKDTLIDGVVISVNNLGYQEKLGRTGNKPTGNLRSKIAFKFRDEIKETIVKNIIFQVGRTGNLTPVLEIKSVQLEGTQISKCTAHNLGVIKDNKIGVGTIIEIIKSGKIIPKIKKVIEAKGDSLIPEFCPSCDNKLIEVEGNNNTLSLNCNNKNCPAQNIKMLNHYLNTLGVKGIAEKNIEKIVETGLLQKRSDFYKLDSDKLIEAGFTERTSILIIARILKIIEPEDIKDNFKLKQMITDKRANGKIPISIEKFIASFGIDGSGKENGRILSKKFNDFEVIRNLTIEQLEKVSGIGPITAKNINEFFKENKEEIDEQLIFIKLEGTKMAKNNDLENKVFCLSGKLENGKKYWQELLEGKGAEVKGSMGRSVNYLVVGEGSGLKMKKAQELGIEILTTEDLEKMLQN